MDPNLSRPAAFILAGGSSRRMGRDKATLDWGSHTLVEHMIGLLRQITEDVRVVGRDGLPDQAPGEGPVEGIRTALAATNSEENIIIAVDLPFVTVGLLDQIARSLHKTEKSLVVVETGNDVPLCIGVRKNLLSMVERYRNAGGRSLGGFIAQVDRYTLTQDDLERLGLDPTVFRNLNTPEDYEDARRLAFGPSPG